VFLLSVYIVGVQGELLSLNKPTSGSSVVGGTNEGVVNGNTAGIFTDGQCSHSVGTTNNWWKVYLLVNAKIDTIKIYNRMDCCQERINGAQVFVGDGRQHTLCGTVAYVSGQSVYEFSCYGMEGDSVKVEQNNNYLTLCEVQVYGTSTLSGPELLSLNKPTSASSVVGGTNEGVVNGNTAGIFTDGQCSHSVGTTDNWWQVDWGHSAYIDIVVIYNRMDCCQERINGVEVFVGDQLCGEVVYFAGQSVYVVECGGKVGDSVRVEQDNNYLTLCEVQVYGEKEEAIVSNRDHFSDLLSGTWK